MTAPRRTRDTEMETEMNGKKTYTAAFAMVAYGVAGLVASMLAPDSGISMDANQAMTFIMNGLALAGLRHAV